MSYLTLKLSQQRSSNHEATWLIIFYHQLSLFYLLLSDNINM